MRREDLQELHYITPIANVPSILEFGILSHVKAETVYHRNPKYIKIDKGARGGNN